MENYTYQPKGVCATEIQFGIEDGKLHNVRFTRGCNGNLQAIGKLLEGQDAANVRVICAETRVHPAQISWLRHWIRH